MQSLPPSFRSLYRLLLRSCSATVLHQPKATRHLRLLYRPLFDAGAEMMQKYQQETGDARKTEIQNWLSIWNNRIDETLELLYNSSQSRGLSHEVTHNLSKLVLSEKRRQWQIENAYNVWDAKATPSPARTAKSLENLEKKRKSRLLADNSLAALTEIIQMAEARGNLSLGRTILKRRVRKI